MVLFFLGTTALWISLDQSPGHWDDAWYLTNSLTLYDALLDHGFIGYWKKFLGTLEFKAPLIAVLPTPLYGLFGRHSRVAYGVNLVFMASVVWRRIPLRQRATAALGPGLSLRMSLPRCRCFTGSRGSISVEYALTALVAADGLLSGGITLARR